jgi:hypothetical protein
MIGELYEKVKTKSGRAKYRLVPYGWDFTPAEGIWYIKDKGSGRESSWICKKIEDLPKAMTVAKLKDHERLVCKVVDQILEQMEVTDDGRVWVPSYNEIFKKISWEIAERESKNSPLF